MDRRRAIIVGAILLTTLVVWHVLAGWLPHGSERFYLLWPIAAVVLVGVATPDGWRTVRAQARHSLIFVGCLAILCLGYQFYLTSILFPFGTSLLSHSANWRETAVALWYLSGVCLLVFATLAILRVFVARLLRQEPAKPSLLAQAAAPLLLAVLTLPYIIATVFVHRVKVPNPPSPPGEYAERRFEDVQFTTADGLTLRGWFFPTATQDIDRTLLVCHGLGANRTGFLTFLDIGTALGAHVLMFDMRGHGDSDGHTVTMGSKEKLDVLAAVSYLRTERSRQARQLIGLGISMGSAALTRAAAEIEPPLDAVIIDSGFASAVELTDWVLRIFPGPVRPLLTTPGLPIASLEAGCWLPDLRPEDDIDRLRAPVLIVHARGDTMIPVSHAERLFHRARAPKKLWIAESNDHGGAVHFLADYRNAVKALVDARE
jgi:alpha-beta hydrolase superfamily lysophospholipase